MAPICGAFFCKNLLTAGTDVGIVNPQGERHKKRRLQMLTINPNNTAIATYNNRRVDIVETANGELIATLLRQPNESRGTYQIFQSAIDRIVESNGLNANNIEASRAYEEVVASAGHSFTILEQEDGYVEVELSNGERISLRQDSTRRGENVGVIVEALFDEETFEDFATEKTVNDIDAATRNCTTVTEALEQIA